MTSEFRIDKPGVYCRRDGYHVYLWPTPSHGPMKWFEICSDPPASYQDNGSFWRGDCESSFDIVAYVSPLPAEILQRMAEALEAAEYCPQQTTPATFGEVLKAMAENGADETAQPIECQLCGTIVNEPRVEWQYCNACTQEQSQ